MNKGKLIRPMTQSSGMWVKESTADSDPQCFRWSSIFWKASQAEGRGGGKGSLRLKT